ncbi:hypothetical protein [Schaalia vaccimaxillae]|uniref:hypothetical protein n=1 Tax=Schaalia vaccimaxillae TaxID=183916 RepID=UPI0003B779E5|nr:hypothetical protein [Schaalia vaccimaxillae]
MTGLDPTNPQRPIAVVTQEQLNALHAALTGPIEQRMPLDEAAKTGLAELGILDSLGLTPNARPIFEALESAEHRVCSVLVNPSAPEQVTNLRMWLSPTSTTVERTDHDGIHLYAVDAPEVGHVLVSNTNLQPTALVSDGPPWIPASALEALRTGDVATSAKVLADTGSQGPDDSLVGQAMRDGSWSLSLIFREELTEDGWGLSHHITLLRTPAMLYQVEAPAFGIGEGGVPVDGECALVPLPGTQAWALVAGLLQLEAATEGL